MKRYGHYINGSYVQNEHFVERVFPDPLHGPSAIAISTLSLNDPTSDELFKAALIGAHESWQQVQEGFFPLEERLEFLKRLALSIDKHQENFAQLLMRETFKPIKLARVEISRALNTLNVCIKSAPQFLESKRFDHNKDWSPNHKIEIQRVPRGVILAISPFNFPVNLVAHKIFPALACGSPVILKPSDKAPLSSLYMMDLCHHDRLPAGMLQLLHCENEVTEKLASDSRVSFVSFTGSSKVGWNLAKKTTVPFSLELGGNAPVFVDENTDLKTAAKKISEGAFMHAGQSCISVQNVYVHKNIAQEFTVLLQSEVEKFPYGNPENENVLCGAPINIESLNRIKNSLEQLQIQGAKILAQSKNYLGNHEDVAKYFSPTLISEISESSFFCQEEIFAPLMSLTTLNSFDDFLKIAKSRTHRLQCGIFTKNSDHIKKARNLDYGGILINESSTFRIDAQPYGGQGLAGIGREGPLYAMEDFTTYKSIIEN
jgi:acyl-CoA reductase-like NAD-dependent aldehyde dehydrogenase